MRIAVWNSHLDEMGALAAAHIGFYVGSTARRPAAVISGTYSYSPRQTVHAMADSTGMEPRLATMLIWYPPNTDRVYESIDDFVDAVRRGCAWPEEDLATLRERLEWLEDQCG